LTPLRVAIGAIAGVTGGPATYAVELVHALEALADPRLELLVLTDRPDLFAALARTRVAEIPLPSPWRQPWWDNVAVPVRLRGVAADVYHGTKHALPLLPLAARTARVVTIHDLAVLVEPETFSFAQHLQLLVHLRHAARVADRVICVSQHAAEDVRTRLGVAAERIAVVPHGVGARFVPLRDQARREAVRRSYGAGDGFLISFVGTAQPRKRIEVAVAAVARLHAEGMPVTLVIAGRRRPGYAAAWIDAPPPFVRIAGELDAASLVELYGASDVMVSPSSFEGFGLTFVEAMACGCPVVGIAATSVPEVVGDGGLLVERPEPDLVAAALARLLSDPEVRAATAARALERAGALSWRRAAEQTRDVYLAASASHRSSSAARAAGEHAPEGPPGSRGAVPAERS
jgi:glycosyltransferase involved in cell wall biosynthesis